MKKLILSFTAFVAVSFMASAQANDWANHPRYAADNAKLTQAPEVVFMGNSITDGWDDRHIEFFTDNNFACRGISGQVTGRRYQRYRWKSRSDGRPSHRRKYILDGRNRPPERYSSADCIMSAM